jgi:hypothetical protein
MNSMNTANVIGTTTKALLSRYVMDHKSLKSSDALLRTRSRNHLIGTTESTGMTNNKV